MFTHTKAKNKAADQKYSTISLTESSLQQEEENHMWPGKFKFKEFWTHFLIPINQKYFLKYERILHMRHL